METTIMGYIRFETTKLGYHILGKGNNEVALVIPLNIVYKVPQSKPV